MLKWCKPKVLIPWIPVLVGSHIIEKQIERMKIKFPVIKLKLLDVLFSQIHNTLDKRKWHFYDV